MRPPSFELTPTQLSVHRHVQARMARMALYIYEMECVLSSLDHDDYGAVLLALRRARESMADAQTETSRVGRPWSTPRLTISVAS